MNDEFALGDIVVMIGGDNTYVINKIDDKTYQFVEFQKQVGRSSYQLTMDKEIAEGLLVKVDSLDEVYARNGIQGK